MCVVHGEDGTWSALDNRCPHQGGPLGRRPARRRLADLPVARLPVRHRAPGSRRRASATRRRPTPYAPSTATTGARDRGPRPRAGRRSLMDQVVDVLCDWGLEAVFGMVGHSNLGMADALRKAEADGRLTYVGHPPRGRRRVRRVGLRQAHRRTRPPASPSPGPAPPTSSPACGTPRSTASRSSPSPARCRPRSSARAPSRSCRSRRRSTRWPSGARRSCRPTNATELAALAMKHAIVQRDVAHLVLPDDVQELPGLDDPPPGPAPVGWRPPPSPRRRTSWPAPSSCSAPPSGRPSSSATAPGRTATTVMALAEHLDAPVISTFKAKGTFPDDHPLGCGVLGRSRHPGGEPDRRPGRLPARARRRRSRNHTSIPTWVPTIQVDLDRMILGKFHPVEVPLWGDIARTIAELLRRACRRSTDRPSARTIATRWARWRAEKASRRDLARRPRAGSTPRSCSRCSASSCPTTPSSPSTSATTPTASGTSSSAAAARTCSCPATSARSASPSPPRSAPRSPSRRAGSGRKVVSISGDGGLGQYLAEVTTAVKEGFPLTHVVLDNGELAKISREQLGAIRPVWQTNLVNPDFAEFATSVRRRRVLGPHGRRAAARPRGGLRHRGRAVARRGPLQLARRLALVARDRPGRQVCWGSRRSR